MPKVAADNYYTYEKAVEVVRKLGIKSFKEWCEYISPYIEKVTYFDEETKRTKIDKENSVYKEEKSLKDPKLPSDPRAFYTIHGKKWIGWGDFFGTGNVSPASAEFVSYKEACSLVKALGIRSKKEYREAHKTLSLKQLPRYPENYYPKYGEKFSWKDFLAPKFMDFQTARNYVRSLKTVNTYQNWIDYVQSSDRPKSIPSAPREVYRSEWVSWPDFLGSGNKPKKRSDKPLKIVEK